MRFVRTAENLFGLPQGFTRVEYLQSSGTQYIDTGVFPTQLTEAECRFAVTGSVSNVDSHLFGSRLSASSEAFDLAYMNTQPNGIEKFRFIHGTTTTQESTTSVTASQLANPHTYYMSGTSFKVDGSEKMSFTTASFTGTYSLWLFGVNSAGSLHNQVRAQKVYRCKIWDNGLLVRDFIPCIDPLSVACMYDLVGKKPYYNIGTGTFTAGRQVIPVEYLESTGTQYIDAGVGGDLTTELTCEASIVQAGNASVTNIMGNNVTSSRAITINMSANITNPSPSRIRFGNTDNTTDAGAINLNTFYKYDTNKNELTVRNGSGTVLNTYPLNATTAFTTNGNIFIFKLGDTSTQYIGKIKVKGATIKNSGVLVRDFIPCKDENNVGFMFDKVSGTVYLNAGTGAFSVGENKYTSKLRLIKDAKELPDGYKRVEYLESSGTQYIDSDIYGNLNTKIEAKVYSQRASSSDSGYCIAGDFTTSTKAITMPFNFTSSGLYSRFGDKAITSGIQQQAGTYTFAIDKDGYYVDGVKIASFNTTTNFTTTNTIMLLGFNGLGRNYFIGKMYYLKIFNNGNLVRDFVPCLDKENNPCLLDMVESKPYYNAGSGNFTYGHIITPVEYLESTGTQYIDTGYNPTATSTYKSIFELTNITTTAGAWFCIFGSVESNNSTFTELFLPRASGAGDVNQIIAGSHNSTYLRKDYTWVKDTKYTFEMTPTNVLINGVNQGSITTDSSITCSHSIYLFARHEFNDAVRYNASAKIYSFSIYNNGTLVRSFIPVRDENNVGYMFDEVTGQLFGNAGSGSFGIGNDLKKAKVRFIQDVLPREYRPLKYLESTGTQWINTGMNVNTSTDEIKLYFELKETQNYKWFFGEYDNNARLGLGSGDGVNKRNFLYQQSATKVSDTQMYNTQHLFEINSNGGFLDGTKIRDYLSFASTSSIYLFNLNIDSSSDYRCKSKIWKYEHKRNGVPVRDLYPALRKSDNKPGMYDRITKQFFVNQGTGEFNYG